MKYKKYVMEDVLDSLIDYRGKTPKKSNDGIATLSAKSVKNNFIDYSMTYKISKDEYKRFMVRGFPKIGDIVLTTEAPLGLSAELDRDDIAIAQRLFTLRGKAGVLENKYLLYWLQSKIGQRALVQKETGTTVTGIKQKEFRKIEIELPSLEDQRRIIEVLNPISEKIQINNRINENLRKQINLLCRAWLVDYAPFGYIQPKTWNVVPLSTIADFISGYSYKGSELVNSNVAMATIKNFDRTGGFKLEGYKEIRPSAKLKTNQHVELFDTLVALTDLTQNAEVIGNAEPVLSLLGYQDIIFSMDVVKVIPKAGVSKFLLAALLQDGRFKTHALGYVNETTVLHLSKKALSEFKIPLPPNLQELAPLSNVVEFMYRQIAANIQESTELTRLRDSLLPRLISGELDISNVNI